MKSMLILFVLKIVSLIGATLNTIGFLTFFFWDSLAPYRWPMIFAGIATIAIAEFVSFLLTKKISKNQLELGEEMFVDEEDCDDEAEYAEHGQDRSSISELS